MDTGAPKDVPRGISAMMECTQGTAVIGIGVIAQ